MIKKTHLLVAPFLSEQLLELSKRDDPPLDGRSVRDGFTAEIISHDDVLTGLLLHILMPANKPKKHFKKKSSKHSFYNKMGQNGAFDFLAEIRMSRKDVSI